MFRRRFSIGLPLLALVAFPICAAGDLSDILKDPTYLTTWSKLIASEEHHELWLERYSVSLDGPTVPSSRVTLSDGDYTITWVCQAHNCGARKFVVLFAPDGKAAWGALLKDTRVEKVFGSPNDERLSAIRQYIRKKG